MSIKTVYRIKYLIFMILITAISLCYAIKTDAGRPVKKKFTIMCCMDGPHMEVRDRAGPCEYEDRIIERRLNQKGNSDAQLGYEASSAFALFMHFLLPHGHTVYEIEDLLKIRSFFPKHFDAAVFAHFG